MGIQFAKETALMTLLAVVALPVVEADIWQRLFNTQTKLSCIGFKVEQILGHRFLNV